MVLVICQHFVQVCVGMCACVSEHMLNACVHACTHIQFIFMSVQECLCTRYVHIMYTQVDIHTQHMKASVNWIPSLCSVQHMLAFRHSAVA